MPAGGGLRGLTLLLLLLLLGGRSAALAEAPPLTLRKGDLPLLIVAGHGGKLPLSGAQVREKEKVDDPKFVLFGDAFTNELATDLAGAVAQEWGGEGGQPSLLLNWVHRRYADVNRKPEFTSHDPVGVAHHAAYHKMIDDELARLVAEHGWALLLDIHGQARYETTLLLGTAQNEVVGPWSLEALWGGDGLVARLEEAGFTAEPTSAEGKQRYGGGYTVRHHGADPKVEAWQMEHSRAIRDTGDERARYLDQVARLLVQAMRRPPRF